MASLEPLKSHVLRFYFVIVLVNGPTIMESYLWSIHFNRHRKQ